MGLKSDKNLSEVKGRNRSLETTEQNSFEILTEDQ